MEFPKQEQVYKSLLLLIVLYLNNATGIAFGLEYYELKKIIYFFASTNTLIK